MEQWYIIYNGQQIGPMDKTQLRHYGLNPNSQVWCEGMSEWAPVYTIPELMELTTTSTMNNNAYGPKVSQNYYNNGGYNTDKSKTAAGVLALLLGGLGIQYFYLGKVAAGFITILLSIVTCGVWEIVTFIQGIMMLTMDDRTFYEKYVATDKTFPLF